MTDSLDRRQLLRALAVAGAARAFCRPACRRPSAAGAPEARRARALLLRAAEAVARAAGRRSPMWPPTQPDPGDRHRRSTTSEWGKITFNTDRRCSPTARASSRSPSSTSASSSRSRSRCMSSRTARPAPIVYNQAMFDMPADSPGAAAAARHRLRRLPGPGAARRHARLAQERLGRLPRRGLLPRDRRTLPIRAVGARRRGQHGGGRTGTRNSPTSRTSTSRRRPRNDTIVHQRAARRRVGDRRLPVRHDARQGRGDGRSSTRSICARTSSGSASRR